MPAQENLWIAFDAAGTLFEPAEPISEVYATYFSKHHLHIPPSSWKPAFRNAFLTAPDPIFHPDTGSEATEKHWWRQLVEQAATTIGIPPHHPAISPAFEEIFAHYATGASWQLFPETLTTLTTLRSQGISLAITSNFDSRIHRVLHELDLTKHFHLILTSADAQARKPSPRILQKLLAHTGANPAKTCLTGDSLHHDQGAATAAAIPFYHIDRPTTDLTTFTTWHRETFLRK